MPYFSIQKRYSTNSVLNTCTAKWFSVNTISTFHCCHFGPLDNKRNGINKKYPLVAHLLGQLRPFPQCRENGFLLLSVK